MKYFIFYFSLMKPKISYNFNYESPLKTPSSKLPTFYFKIGQLMEFDHKKAERKNTAQFFDQLEARF